MIRCPNIVHQCYCQSISCKGSCSNHKALQWNLLWFCLSVSDWWEVTHILLLPLYASILLLFNCQVKSVSFSPQNLLDRTGTACSKPTRASARTHTHTHTDKAHHSQCNYHAVWLYTAFNNPCVSYSACINPAVRKHCVGSFQLYAGIFFTQAECTVLLEIKGKQKILVGADYIWIS